jgi:hypothetical protein
MVAWVDHVYACAANGIGAFRLTGTYPSFIRTTYLEEVYRHRTGNVLVRTDCVADRDDGRRAKTIHYGIVTDCDSDEDKHSRFLSCL